MAAASHVLLFLRVSQSDGEKKNEPSLSAINRKQKQEQTQKKNNSKGFLTDRA